jgi:hypothetical protein
MKFPIVLLLSACILSCSDHPVNQADRKKDEANLESDDAYYLHQHPKAQDSALIIYTVARWHYLDFNIYRDAAQFNEYTNKDISISISHIFYSPDRRKMLVWLCERSPHVDNQTNKKVKGESVYDMSTIIGIRDDTQSLWKLYPYGTISAYGKSEEEVVAVYCDFYFHNFSGRGQPEVVQSGLEKGHFAAVTSEPNLRDSAFFATSYLFHADTVGGNNLYPFQIKEYKGVFNFDTDSCIKCAVELITPAIDYPEQIAGGYRHRQ